MRKLWWTQIKAVIRLEIKKTFLARRSLWIYVLALLPLLLFVVRAVLTSREGEQRARFAAEGERKLTYQDLQAIKTGMTSQEVIAFLGKPPVRSHWNRRMLVPAERAPAGASGSGTPVNLSEAYNRNGISSTKRSFADGLDGSGFAYSSSLLPATTVLNGVPFEFGPADRPDAVAGAGQAIRLPAGRFTGVQLLGTATSGPLLSQTFTVTYTDGSTDTFRQNLSDWCSCSS